MALIVIIGGGYFLLQGADGSTSSRQTGTLLELATTTTPLATTPTGAVQASSTAALPTPSTQAVQTSSLQATNQLKNIMHATLHTNMGDITLELYRDQAPQTVENFVKLASTGFYDGVKFHRVIKDFMDQAGDPLTRDDTATARWGTGGPGYTIPDEIGPKNSNGFGTLAMANTGAPHTAGSQFFINAKDNHFLDSGYTVFGKVIVGLDVVTTINNTPTDKSNDRPLKAVIINSITLK